MPTAFGDGAFAESPRENRARTLRDRATALVDRWIACRRLLTERDQLDDCRDPMRANVAATLALLGQMEARVWMSDFPGLSEGQLGMFDAQLTRHEEGVLSVEQRLGLA